MKVLSAEFVKSCDSPEQFPRDRLPEIAFVGRSNVGKSSLINFLLGRKGLAKVSHTPGKTRILNFFLVTTADPLVKQFYLVDLPGYGYAKVAKSVRAHWGPMIERYVKSRSALRGVLLLVDPRRTDVPDVGTLDWLLGLGQRPVVVATKLDKLSRAARLEHLEMIRGRLNLGEDIPLVPCSSVSQEGRNELWQVIRKLLAAGR